MKSIKFSNRYTKYIAILLVAVFLVAAALMALEMWDRHHGKFPSSGDVSDVINYNGKEYLPKENLDTLLVLGLDKYDGEGMGDSYNNDKQSDFLMLFVFDNNNKTCSALQINRDSMVDVNVLGVSGEKIGTVKSQIALAHTYGNGQKVSCRNVTDAVEKLLDGVHVDHYVSFTMDSVTAVNDFVGGVEVKVLDDFTGIDEALVKDTVVTLRGEQALTYVRSRYGLEDSSNNTRMKRQQQYIEALYDKTMSLIAEDEGFLINLVDTMDEYVVYDSSDKKMQKFAEKFDEYEFLGISDIAGESKPGKKFMEFYPDEKSVREIVIDMFYEPKK